MKFIQGKPRNQWEMYCLDAHVDADNEVRLIDLFVDSLNLSELGFKVDYKENGRPAYHPGALRRLFIPPSTQTAPKKKTTENDLQQTRAKAKNRVGWV